MSTLQVERATVDSGANSRALAQVSAETARALGAAAGQAVRLLSERACSTVARLEVKSGLQKNSIHLDRHIRRALKAHLNDPVQVEPVELNTLSMLELTPAVDVSTAHDLIPHIRATLHASQVPLAKGSVVYLTFPHSSGGTTYVVHKLDEAPGLVGPDTKIHLHFADSHTPEGAFEVTFEDIGGLDREIRLVRELVQLPLQFPHSYRQLGIQAPRGILFHGPAGSGKTHLARALANEINARFYYINGPDILGAYAGETEANLKRMFAEAAHHAPSIIFIDEVDAITPRRGQTGAHSDTRVVGLMLTLMDGLTKVDSVVVIGTTNRVDSVDPALRRPGRFDRELFFAPPSEQGRRQILEIHTREMPLEESAEQSLDSLSQRTAGFVGADLMELCREAGLNALRRNAVGIRDVLGAVHLPDERITVSGSDFEKALEWIKPSAMRETLLSAPSGSWDQIAGLEPVKARLKRLVGEALSEDKTGLGILLWGPSGTGKTMLARALAREFSANFIPIEGPELFTQWVGESEEAVRHVFRIARQVAPAIVFFDHLDAIAPVRGNQPQGTYTTERVVNQLLAELDGIEPRRRVVVLGATDRRDLIDPSLLRPGRLGMHIHVPLPDAAARKALVQMCMGTESPDAGRHANEIATKAARKTDGFSGADMVQLCHEAKISAEEESGASGKRQVIWKHFQAALAARTSQTIPVAGTKRRKRPASK
ncbi:MAG: AAA family ATPase [Acidobacteria bacterium]|nr:AAA family ATPase [Acidobacteriota bacterium]